MGKRGDGERFMFDVRVLYFIDMHVAILMVSMRVSSAAIYTYFPHLHGHNPRQTQNSSNRRPGWAEAVDKWMWYAVTAE